jgi:hypothetical protein
MKPTVEQLSDMLTPLGIPPFKRGPFIERYGRRFKEVEGPNVGSEVYGKSARVYLFELTEEKRQEIKAFLQKQGVKVFQHWGKPRPYEKTCGLEIEVRYWKGPGWNE